ncbi:hypothetical protein NEOC65_002361 [Neochlamydia sp. AcF65]|nr:hypothetical protein [Neochlamydia sp. AcF65]
MCFLLKELSPGIKKANVVAKEFLSIQADEKPGLQENRRKF